MSYTLKNYIYKSVGLSTRLSIGFAVTCRLSLFRPGYRRSSRSVLFGGAELPPSIGSGPRKRSCMSSDFSYLLRMSMSLILLPTQ